MSPSRSGGRRFKPYTSYLFVVGGGGAGEILATGKTIAEAASTGMALGRAFRRVEGLYLDDLVELRVIVPHLRARQFGRGLRLAEAELSSKNAAAAGEARRVIDALRSYGEERRGELEKLKAASPIYAVDELVKLAEEFASSGLGKSLLDQARAWNREPATKRARKARRLLELAEETAEKIEGKGRADDPNFTRRYLQELRLIMRCAKKLKEDHPETESCKRAMELLKRLGLSLPD